MFEPQIVLIEKQLTTKQTKKTKKNEKFQITKFTFQIFK